MRSGCSSSRYWASRSWACFSGPPVNRTLLKGNGSALIRSFFREETCANVSACRRTQTTRYPADFFTEKLHAKRFIKVARESQLEKCAVDRGAGIYWGRTKSMESIRPSRDAETRPANQPQRLRALDPYFAFSSTHVRLLPSGTTKASRSTGKLADGLNFPIPFIFAGC